MGQANGGVRGGLTTKLHVLIANERTYLVLVLSRW